MPVWDITQQARSTIADLNPRPRIIGQEVRSIAGRYPPWAAPLAHPPPPRLLPPYTRAQYRTAHGERVAAYAIAVPHNSIRHTLSQYRTPRTSYAIPVRPSGAWAGLEATITTEHEIGGTKLLTITTDTKLVVQSYPQSLLPSTKSEVQTIESSGGPRKVGGARGGGDARLVQIYPRSVPHSA
eukprot:1655880-Rhodomonas_salina.2